MYTTRHIKDLTSKTILDLISEYQIFKYYIGRDFDIGDTISSPYRTDKNPSFRVYRTSHGLYSLRFQDYATSDQGSCFDLVMRIYNCTFFDSLRIIDRDFGLNINDPTGQLATVSRLFTDIPEYQKCIIKVKIRSWLNNDKVFWGDYGISINTLIYHDIFPLECFNISGNQNTCKNITYGYYFGEGMWKIYRPLEERFRWLSNTTTDIIQGFNQLPKKADILVITKSLKDCMLLYELEIAAIAPQSEHVVINEDIMSELKNKFKKIYVLFDFDYTGIKGGNKYKKLYSIQPLYLTNGRFRTINYKAKDISDYYKFYGKESLLKLIEQIKNKKE